MVYSAAMYPYRFAPGLFGGVFLLFSTVIYFVPTIVAVARRHHNMVPIILVNLLLGWSCIGWIAALVWSFTTPQPMGQQVVYNQYPQPYPPQYPPPGYAPPPQGPPQYPPPGYAPPPSQGPPQPPYPPGPPQGPPTGGT